MCSNFIPTGRSAFVSCRCFFSTLALIFLSYSLLAVTHPDAPEARVTENALSITNNYNTALSRLDNQLDEVACDRSNCFEGNLIDDASLLTTAPASALLMTVGACNELAPCDAVISNIEQESPSCPAGTDGSIRITATCSTCTSIEYSIGGDFQVSSVFNNVAAGFYTVTIQDAGGSGCTTANVVTVSAGTDLIDPVADCANIIVQLGSNNQATIQGIQLDAGSSFINRGSTDNCEITSFTAVPNTFTCDDVGDNNVTLIVTDVGGNTASCVSVVTVGESTLPSFTNCASGSISLMNFCTSPDEAVIEDILGAPLDNCGFVNAPMVDVAPPSIQVIGGGVNIFSPGNQVVGGQLSGSIFSRGTAGSSGNRWPFGESPALAIDQRSNTKYLNFAETFTGIIVRPSGGASTAGAIRLTTANDEPSRDPATFRVYGTNANFSLSASSYSLSNFTLIASGNTNLSSRRFSTQVVNFNNSDAYTTYMIIFPTVRNASSANSMQIAEVQLLTVGTVTENWVASVEDDSGNTGFCTVQIQTETTPPVARCQNLTVQLDASGQASITGEMVDANSTDNCSIAEYTLSTSSFNCNSIGVRSTTLTVRDAAGNESSCTANVTVQDMITPTIECPDDIPAALNPGSCTANVNFGVTVSDNCPPFLTYSNTPGSAFNKGTTEVTVTADDQNGNRASCSFNVIVTDEEDPVAVCNDIDVVLADQNSNALSQVQLDAIAAGTSDNCPGVTYAITAGETNYDCSDIGLSLMVTLTATDAVGRTNSCDATITVTDPNVICSVPPTAVCADVTVVANDDCESDISAAAAGAMVGSGSSDANGDDLTFSISPEGPFSVGTTPVTVTVSDGSASSQCTASVIVQAPDISVNDDGNTDLGAVIQTEALRQDYTITNDGTSPLSLTTATITGQTGMASWTLSGFSDNLELAVGASTSFTANFSPANNFVGNSTALISIGSDDCDENPYTFTVSAESLKARVHNETQNIFYLTITDAITAAVAEDVLIVSEGTFTENVDLSTKVLTIRIGIVDPTDN